MQKYIVLPLLVLGTFGCVNQQKEIGTYRKILDDKVSLTVIEFKPTQPLSLQQSLVLANRHNEQLGIKGEEYLQALIDKDRVFSAFLPTIGLGPSYSLQDSYKTMPLLSPPNQHHTWDVPFTGQLNVFNGFRDVANLRRAAAGIDRQQALLQDLQESLLLEVAQTYYQILRDEQVAQVLKNSVLVQEKRVADIQARQKVGLAKALDVSQTQAQASGTRVSQIRAQTQGTNGRSVLAFLIGQPLVTGPLTDQYPLPNTRQPLTFYLDQAVGNRNDFHAAQAAVRAAQEILQSALREYLPSITLNANYFAHREVLPRDLDWTAMIQGNVPIFTGGRIEANIRTAYSVLRQAKLSESHLRRQIEQQVRVTYENLQSSQLRLTELKVELTAADEAYKQATESYLVGLATNLDQLIAQDRQLSAQVQLTSEEYNQKIFYLDLLRSAGRFMDDRPDAGLRPEEGTRKFQ
jgi:outer membrane protein TolC